jgi:hypothetical protein
LGRSARKLNVSAVFGQLYLEFLNVNKAGGLGYFPEDVCSITYNAYSAPPPKAMPVRKAVRAAASKTYDRAARKLSSHLPMHIMQR